MSAEKAETAVWETIDEALQKPETFREAAIRYEDSRGARDVELQSRVAHLQKQIAKIRQDERRLIDLFVGDREQQELVQAKLRALAKQKAGLAEHLQRAEEQAAKHGALSRLDAIERLCEQARRGLDRLDADGRRKLLLDLVDEIKIGHDRSLEIYGFLATGDLYPPS